MAGTVQLETIREYMRAQFEEERQLRSVTTEGPTVAIREALDADPKPQRQVTGADLDFFVALGGGELHHEVADRQPGLVAQDGWRCRFGGDVERT